MQLKTEKYSNTPHPNPSPVKRGREFSLLKLLPRGVCRFVVAMLLVVSFSIFFPSTAKAYNYNCMVGGSPFRTHYGMFNGPEPGTDSTAPANTCVACWVESMYGCLDSELGLVHSWSSTPYQCAQADIVNPFTVCFTGNYKPAVSRLSAVAVQAQANDTYYRDLCINSGQLAVADFDTNTGMPISVAGVAFAATDTSTLYGRKVVGFVTGAKPARNTCMSAVNTPKYTPPTTGNSAYAAYKNANNVDFVTNGVDAEGANGERKKAYGDSQNLYISGASFMADASCPSSITANAPQTASDWKTRAGLCYDYYILNRAAHPEWTLERAGQASNDPLSATAPSQSIFNNCQPLMNGNNAKTLIAGASITSGLNGYAPVLQYKNRPDLDEAEYDPSTYLTRTWNKDFSGKTAPAFQNLFPCVKTDNSSVMTVNWPAFNATVFSGYAIIAVIECTILPRSCDGPNYQLPVGPDPTPEHAAVRSDYNYSSVGGSKFGFCPLVEKINDPSHPFSPRDDYKKVAMIAGNEIYSPTQSYGTDRGYSWETSLYVIKERALAGFAWGYTDYNDPTAQTKDKLIDRQKHPPVMCGIVPVDILEPRRKAFDNCIMQRIEYNYFSWRFNNFVDYYGIKNQSWTPPCKTRFYESDSASDCPVKMSIQQCCRIIVKDVVPVNYLKMRTCEGLRQKRNLILGYDHIYDGAGTSANGKPVTVTDQASYDAAALLNQKLSLIGCDKTEPDDYGFQHYFKPDLLSFDGKVPTDVISTGINVISKIAYTALTTARGVGNTAISTAAAPAWTIVSTAQSTAATAVISLKTIADTATSALKAAESNVSMAQSSVNMANAAIKANTANISASTAISSTTSTINATASLATATAQLAIAQTAQTIAKQAETTAIQALSKAQDTYNQAMEKAQTTAQTAVQKAMTTADSTIEKVRVQANDKSAQAVDKIKSNAGQTASKAIDTLLNSMGTAATLVEGGSHMPYMRWWDTGVSAGNTTHGGSFINTMGSYDVIIGVGREERDYFDAKDTGVKTRLDNDKQLLTQTSQMGRINGWEGLKGHQMWTTRLNALSCIGRHEKLFKAQGSAENFVLSRAGTQYFNKQASYPSGISPTTDSSGRPWSWALGWRGYANDPNNDFEANSTITGLSKAQKGDIIIFPLNGIKQIAFVADTSSTEGSPTFVKVESWDQGKFPTAAGVSISAGNVVTRTIYQTSVPPDDQNLVASATDNARTGSNPSCEDPNYTGCVLPAGGWDSVEIYRPAADTSRLCPVDQNMSVSETSHFDTNNFADCVNKGYDPPVGMRKGYSGTGTGTQQNNTLCGASWGTCTTSSSVTKTTCFPSGTDCTKP